MPLPIGAGKGLWGLRGSRALSCLDLGASAEKENVRNNITYLATVKIFRVQLATAMFSADSGWRNKTGPYATRRVSTKYPALGFILKWAILAKSNNCWCWPNIQTSFLVCKLKKHGGICHYGVHTGNLIEIMHLEPPSWPNKLRHLLAHGCICKPERK